MKTMILSTLMMIATSTAFAGKERGCLKNTFRELSSAAEEIQSQAAADNRVVVDRTNPSYAETNAIGVVTKPNSSGYGTGFLISPCHVLTNAHVVAMDRRKSSVGSKVKFSVGQDPSGEKQFTEFLVDGTVVAQGIIDHKEALKSKEYKPKKSDTNTDWAVIKLSKPIGKKVGFLTYSQADYKHLKDLSVITAGFPGSRTQNGADLSKMYGDINCKILGINAETGYLQHTCQTSPGQSGSPIIVKDSKGKLHAIGMISGEMGFGMNETTVADDTNSAVNFSSGKMLGTKTDGDKIVDAAQANSCE